jgi:hypothetical protein
MVLHLRTHIRHAASFLPRALAAALLTTPALAEQITVRDLTGPALSKPGQIFQWPEAEGAYFTVVGDLGEIWRVSAEGNLMERASLLRDESHVHILWASGDRSVFELDEVLEIDLTGGQAAFVQNLAQLLTAALKGDTFGLPKGARFKADRTVVDANERHLGSWDVATGGIITLTESTSTRDVPISKLLEVMGGA